MCIFPCCREFAAEKGSLETGSSASQSAANPPFSGETEKGPLSGRCDRLVLAGTRCLSISPRCLKQLRGHSTFAVSGTGCQFERNG